MERITVTTIKRRGGETRLYCDICKSEIEQGTAPLLLTENTIETKAKALADGEVDNK